MVRHLILAGHDVHVVTGAPEFVFTSVIESPRLFIRKVNKVRLEDPTECDTQLANSQKSWRIYATFVVVVNGIV